MVVTQIKQLVKIGLAMLVFSACYTQAAEPCQVKLQDDIIISVDSVRIVRASGDLMINPVGEVKQNGKVVSISKTASQQAQKYQQALRQKLPEIDSQAKAHLQRAHSALDNIVVQELGTDSKIRAILTKLVDELGQEMAHVLENKGQQEIIFHHKAIQQIEKEGRTKVERALGLVVQEGINEMGKKSLDEKSTNPLITLVTGLGGFQQKITEEWQRQEKDLQKFGHDLCQQVVTLEKQRVELLKQLPVAKQP